MEGNPLFTSASFDNAPKWEPARRDGGKGTPPSQVAFKLFESAARCVPSIGMLLVLLQLLLVLVLLLLLLLLLLLSLSPEKA